MARPTITILGSSNKAPLSAATATSNDNHNHNDHYRRRNRNTNSNSAAVDANNDSSNSSNKDASTPSMAPTFFSTRYAGQLRRSRMAAALETATSTCTNGSGSSVSVSVSRGHNNNDSKGRLPYEPQYDRTLHGHRDLETDQGGDCQRPRQQAHQQHHQQQQQNSPRRKPAAGSSSLTLSSSTKKGHSGHPEISSKGYIQHSGNYGSGSKSVARKSTNSTPESSLWHSPPVRSSSSSRPQLQQPGALPKTNKSPGYDLEDGTIIHVEARRESQLSSPLQQGYHRAPAGSSSVVSSTTMTTMSSSSKKHRSLPPQIQSIQATTTDFMQDHEVIVLEQDDLTPRSATEAGTPFLNCHDRFNSNNKSNSSNDRCLANSVEVIYTASPQGHHVTRRAATGAYLSPTRASQHGDNRYAASSILSQQQQPSATIVAVPFHHQPLLDPRTVSPMFMVTTTTPRSLGDAAAYAAAVVNTTTPTPTTRNITCDRMPTTSMSSSSPLAQRPSNLLDLTILDDHHLPSSHLQERTVTTPTLQGTAENPCYWCVAAIHQLEEHYQTETAVLQHQLLQAKHTRRAYKQELRDSLMQRLHCLEHRLTNTASSSSSAVSASTMQDAYNRHHSVRGDPALDDEIAKLLLLHPPPKEHVTRRRRRAPPDAFGQHQPLNVAIDLHDNPAGQEEEDQEDDELSWTADMPSTAPYSTQSTATATATATTATDPPAMTRSWPTTQDDASSASGAQHQQQAKSSNVQQASAASDPSEWVGSVIVAHTPDRHPPPSTSKPRDSPGRTTTTSGGDSSDHRKPRYGGSRPPRVIGSSRAVVQSQHSNYEEEEEEAGVSIRCHHTSPLASGSSIADESRATAPSQRSKRDPPAAIRMPAGQYGSDHPNYPVNNDNSNQESDAHADMTLSRPKMEAPSMEHGPMGMTNEQPLVEKQQEKRREGDDIVSTKKIKGTQPQSFQQREVDNASSRGNAPPMLQSRQQQNGDSVASKGARDAKSTTASSQSNASLRMKAQSTPGPSGSWEATTTPTVTTTPTLYSVGTTSNNRHNEIDDPEHVESLKRLQELELKLQQAIAFHKSDGVATRLEQALMTAEFEQVHQEKHQREQRRHWKEKTKVLRDLLELTDLQHSAEKMEWQNEKDLLENTISQLTADKSALRESSELAKKQATKLQQHVQELLQQEQVHDNQNQVVGPSSSSPKRNLPPLSPSRRNNVVHITSMTVTDWNDADLTYAQQEVAKLKQRLDQEHTKNEQERSKLKAEYDARLLRNEQEFKNKIKEQERDYLNRLSTKECEWTNQAELMSKRFHEQMELKEVERKKVLDMQVKELRALQEARDADDEKREADNKVLLTKYHEAVDRCKGLESHVASLQTDHEKENHEWEEKLEQASRDIAVAHDQMKKLEAQIEVIRGEHDRQVQGLRQELLDTKEKAQSQLSHIVEAHVHESTQLQEQYRSRIDELTQELKRVKNVAELQLLETIEKHGQELLRMQNRLRLTQEAETKASEHFLQEQEQRQQVEAELQEVEALNRQQADDSFKIRAEMERLQDEKHRLQEDFEASREKLEQEIQATHESNVLLVDRTNKLASQLVETSNTHLASQSRWDKEAEQWKNQNDQLEADISALRSHQEQQFLRMKTMEGHEDVLLAMQYIQNEMRSLRNALQRYTSPESDALNHNEAIADGDVTGDLDSGADPTLIKGREALELIIQRLSISLHGKVDISFDRGTLSSEGSSCELLNEIDVLRKEIQKGIENLVEASTDHRQDAALESLNGEVENLARELSAERAKRDEMDREVSNLNEQADAYIEEIMRLQSVNCQLEEAVNHTERKIEILLSSGRPHNVDKEYLDISMEYQMQTKDSLRQRSLSFDDQDDNDETSPMLEEALALAQGLTDVVHGRGDYGGKETTVMEMLETLSDMMDQHDRAGKQPPEPSSSLVQTRNGSKKDDPIKPPLSPGKRASPARKLSSHAYIAGGISVQGKSLLERKGHGATSAKRRESSLAPVEMARPIPALSQAEPSSSPSTPPKDLLAGQAYEHCQPLQREREQLVESAMDLLETARTSTPAEMDAAVATLRRQATRGIFGIHEHDQLD